MATGTLCTWSIHKFYFCGEVCSEQTRHTTLILYFHQWIVKVKIFWLDLFFVSLSSGDHKESSDKKHRDKEREKMKHKDGSTDKYKDKHKEKRKEEKVNYANNSWKDACVVVHVMLWFCGSSLWIFLQYWALSNHAVMFHGTQLHIRWATFLHLFCFLSRYIWHHLSSEWRYTSVQKHGEKVDVQKRRLHWQLFVFVYFFFRWSPLMVKSKRKKRMGLPGMSGLHITHKGYLSQQMYLYDLGSLFSFSPHMKSEPEDDFYHSPKQTLKRERDEENE